MPQAVRGVPESSVERIVPTEPGDLELRWRRPRDQRDLVGRGPERAGISLQGTPTRRSKRWRAKRWSGAPRWCLGMTLES